MIQEVMVITIAITVAFMVLCFATDLRERMIYAFPCMTLIALWTVLGVISTGQYMLIGIAVSVHLAIYFALKIIGIWGDGDSDVFLLYGIIFMTMMLTDKYEIGVTMYMILELIGMVFALLVSFVVALIEAKIKGQKLTKKSSVAVVPGFAVVIVLMVLKIIFWR